MSEDETEKQEAASQDKKQTQEVKKDFTVAYQVKPMNLRRKVELFLELLFWVITSISGLIIILVASLVVLQIFPDYVPISYANDLLNILINADGILLGFVGIVFAQLLSSLMDQQNTLYQRIIEKPKEAPERKNLLDFINFRKRLLSLIVVATIGSLLWSILLSMANIATNSKYQLTDTYRTATLLFGPLLFTIIGVILLVLALAGLPLRLPLVETKEGSEKKP